MKKKLSVVIPTVLMIAMLFTSSVAAQYAGYQWATAYQVVNMSDTTPADITVSYYDANGTEITAARKTFLDVPVGGSVLVLQISDDPSLPAGTYSAVVSADQPVAAIVNQQLYPTGATGGSAYTPFSTYSGESTGSNKVVLPAIMYNWYGFYTEFFVMNIGNGDATVNVSYYPTNLSGSDTGASGVTETAATVKQFASKTYSQQAKTALGAPSGTWVGRFFGAAVITANQPIIAVVNQHNTTAKQLMTYNGFASGAQNILIPTHMRGYFGYYTSLSIANPDLVNSAHVTITYTPKTDNIPGTTTPYSAVSSGVMGPVTVNYTIAPGKSIARQDYPGALDDQSDLDDNPVFSRFYGTVSITSDIDVVAQTNVQATNGQAGSLNGIPQANWSQNLVAPVILADFYGYSTTLLIRNTTNAEITCTITYSSDATLSAQPSKTKSYNHTIAADNLIEVYEGHLGGRTDGDINSDTFWRNGSAKQFIGSATISCTGAVVALVNEDKAGTAGDNMYAMNIFNK